MQHSVSQQLHQTAWLRGSRYRLIGVSVLLLLLGVGVPLTVQCGTTPQVTVTPTPIDPTAAEIVNPMRGFYRWYEGEPIPQPRPAYDHYIRYNWRELEPARGEYDFSAIVEALERAEATGAKFAFRVMGVDEFNSPVEVPDYLMQAAGGAYCDYYGQSVWVPDWNSPQFLERAEALVTALGERFNGDPRLGYYDMGIYGHWGEWHTLTLCTPPATTATKHALVDMQLKAFYDTRILMNSGTDEVDAFVYALEKSPRIGIRTDSMCDPWFDNQFTDSPAKLALIQERWKTAPIVTEFMHWNPSDPELCLEQVRRWHVAAVANGSVSTWDSYTPEQQAQVIQIGKDAGYRFVLEQLTYPTEVAAGSAFEITSHWSNVGITPTYERFVVTFELRPQGQANVAWLGSSHLDLEQLLPTTEPISITDQLRLSYRLKPGVYDLSLVVRDPSGYRAPLNLAITGRTDTGRYPLGTLTVQPGPPWFDLFLPNLIS
ncbi:MAG: DUF4832 domain-containing protein [Chloroflexaceae bacterium]